MRYAKDTSRDRELAAQLIDQMLATAVSKEARCADGTLDPDEWFPVSTEAQAARREAVGAIAVCVACPVRGACLELALRYWVVGQHGVWGGLVAAERAVLRRRWPAPRLARAPGEPNAPSGSFYVAEDGARDITGQFITDAGYDPVPLGGPDKARAVEDLVATMNDGVPVFYRFAVPGEL